MTTTTRETRTICQECQDVIEAGTPIQVESIRSAFGGRYEERLSHTDRAICRAVNARRGAERRASVEAARHAADVQAAQRALIATEKQVQYALDLQTSYWTPAVFGGERYNRASLCAMSKLEISRVIDTLLDERSIQNA